VNDYANYQASERLVHSLANRVVRRLRSIPQKVMSKEDIEQELWVAWCKARDSYSSDYGVPFAAYLSRGMKLHINRVVEVQIERFKEQTFALELDRPMDSADGEGGTLMDVIPSDTVGADEYVERNDTFQRAIETLSDRARIVVTLLNDQPQELLGEALLSQKKAEFSRTLGAPFLPTMRITTSMVFDLIGANRSERRKIMLEIKSLGEENSQ
jgi:DNA-directed RNA polymerase specialized sigma24 family protein